MGKKFIRMQEGKTELEITTRERRRRNTEKVKDQVEQVTNMENGISHAHKLGMLPLDA